MTPLVDENTTIIAMRSFPIYENYSILIDWTRTILSFIVFYGGPIKLAPWKIHLKKIMASCFSVWKYYFYLYPCLRKHCIRKKKRYLAFDKFWLYQWNSLCYVPLVLFPNAVTKQSCWWDSQDYCCPEKKKSKLSVERTKSYPERQNHMVAQLYWTHRLAYMQQIVVPET